MAGQGTDGALGVEEEIAVCHPTQLDTTLITWRPWAAIYARAVLLERAKALDGNTNHPSASKSDLNHLELLHSTQYILDL